MYKRFIGIVLSVFFFISASAQIRGVVVDADDGYGVPYASIFLPNLKHSITTDGEGKFELPRHVGNAIVVSCVGYVKQHVTLSRSTDSITVKLKPQSIALEGVTVKSHRKRYSRKNNPAVELMRKVIAHKKETDLSLKPYYSFQKYQKITLSGNQIDTVNHKRKPWFRDQVERSPLDSTKLVLPLMVNEQITKHLYRRDPKRDLDVIEAKRSSGVNKIFQTGDMLNTVLKEVFQDVNINNDYVRLLQYPFPSPLGRTAISFYHFYIEDTVKVDRDSCYHVLFYPANQQDFGFKGQMYITKDSAYQVKECILQIPKKSDVNFVDNMLITQKFSKLPDGQWTLTDDNMKAEVRFTSIMPRMLVVRSTKLGDYSFDPIDDKELRGKAATKEEPSARIRNDAFWNESRPEPLTHGESNMDYFVYRMTKSKNFGWMSIIARMVFENYIETGKPGSKDYFDFGPVSTLVSHNFVDGYRWRVSGRTMADLNPHLFLSGFAAYGASSHKWYYDANLTYSLNRKEKSWFEFPMRNITFESTYDLMSPADKYLVNNKDNVFESFRTQTVRQMYFYNMQKFSFEYENDWGLSYKASFKTEKDKVAGDLHFLPVNGMPEIFDFRTTELSGTIRLNPHQSYINTKQRRWPINMDEPVIELTHTIGFKPVSLTYLADANDETFNLMRNMEFLNDRYVFWGAQWDLNGKIFNRIPLIKKLKWREFVGIKGMWGHLTDKNNPALHPNDPVLMQFPTESHVISNKPYWEAMVGIHNIFKFFGVDYVRRLTYKDLPNVDKWGLRFNFMMSF